MRVVFTGILPNGQKFISGEISSNIQVWDLNYLELEKTLSTESVTNKHPSWWHKCIVISPDNQKIIVAREIIKVYDLESGKLLTTIGKSLGWVYALAITQDGKKLISSYDKKIIIWDLTTKYSDILRTLKSDGDRVYDIAVTPDGQRLVSASSIIYDTDDADESIDCESFIEIWDLNTGEKLHLIKDYDREIYCIAITPDGTKSISGYRDGSIKVWGIPDFDE